VACVLNETTSLVSDSDMHVAHLALQLCASLVHVVPSLAVPHIKGASMPRVLALLQSPVLQGYALRSLLAFLGELVRQDVSELDFDVILSQLMSIAEANMSKHALSALSQAIGICCTRVKDVSKRDGVVSISVCQLRSDVSLQQRILALYCLGEIGRQNDLSLHSSLLDEVTASFASETDEVKAAAAFALGNITAGNLPKFVPHMLSKLHENDAYLMLYALKELIRSGQQQLSLYAQDMVPSLISFAEHEEDGVRNVVSECLGRLAAVSSGLAEVVIPHMIGLLSHLNSHVRATVVQSLRFAVGEVGNSPLPSSLAASLMKFLQAMSDADVEVRRAALLALKSIAHNKPDSIREVLADLLPLLYEQTRKRADLVHQVDLGPFKHTIDDGLELRKAAFECMDTLLAHCADKIDITEFVAHLVDGLKDDHDIKVLCHMMIVKLADSPNSGLILAASLDLFVDPLRATICATLKESAVKHQVERHEDLVRSGMRAARALEKMARAEISVKFDEFVRSTLKKHPFYDTVGDE